VPDAHWQQGLSAAARRTLASLDALLTPQAIREFGLHSPRLHTGLIISGDRFVATSAESTALRQQLPDALAVEMEGAAVAQVCHDHGAPFAAVRTISDRADDAAHVDFVRFVTDVASHYSAHTVLDWLQHLPPPG
jgi:adenosylhomocysteine nucleosidase